MIVYKIYNLTRFEEMHQDYFNSLLDEIKKLNLLSSSIQNIIITDDIEGEIDSYCTIKNSKTSVTKSREYKTIAKTIDFDGSKRIFFDANSINNYSNLSIQIFYEQLIEVYAEDIILSHYKIPQTYSAETPFSDLLKILFSQWATKSLSNSIEKIHTYPKVILYSDIKIFADSFKRNVRKMHYQHQEDLNLGVFWLGVIHELDSFIRRNLDVKSDNGDFTNLQEFSQLIPPLLVEIEKQTYNLLNKNQIDFTLMQNYTIGILNKCFINIPIENPMTVIILDTPKRLFKNSLVDTEPRIVAFIDILGFSEIINEYDSDQYSNILNELHDTLELAIKVSIESITDSKVKSDLQEYIEYRMFSDCICISLPYIEFGNDFHIQFQSIITIIKSYQLAMMQKGFYVRGGISIGSYFSDKNMIFSGGLVNAYRLEKAAVYPVIEIDKKILNRLHKNIENITDDLFIEDSLIYFSGNPNKVFVNPFDILDNSNKYFEYLQTTLTTLLHDKSIEDDQLTKSILNMTSSFVNPIFEFAKSQMTPENLIKSKAEIMYLIEEKLEKFNIKLKNSSETNELNEIKRIIEKYEFMNLLTKWSMGKIDSNFFIHIDLKAN